MTDSLFNKGIKEPAPELQEYLHRPPGAPKAREIKSQLAQLKSGHKHGTQKNLKIGMEFKTGMKDFDRD